MKNIIVEQARSWVGTKFHHQGRIKKTLGDKGGCDCIGLIIGVAKELGIELPDEQNYSFEPNNYQLLNKMSYYLKEKPINTLSPGDIILMKIDFYPQHVGIISNYSENKLGLIHSYLPARKVVENILDHYWSNKIIFSYHFPQFN